jgi:hypothetical protein
MQHIGIIGASWPRAAMAWATASVLVAFVAGAIGWGMAHDVGTRRPPRVLWRQAEDVWDSDHASERVLYDRPDGTEIDWQFRGELDGSLIIERRARWPAVRRAEGLAVVCELARDVEPVVIDGRRWLPYEPDFARWIHRER